MIIVLTVCGSLFALSLLMMVINIIMRTKKNNKNVDNVDYNCDGFQDSLLCNNNSDDLNEIVSCLDNKIKDFKYDYKK